MKWPSVLGLFFMILPRRTTLTIKKRNNFHYILFLNVLLLTEAIGDGVGAIVVENSIVLLGVVVSGELIGKVVIFITL